MNNKKTLKNKIESLKNNIKKKREGTGNFFTWKPKQNALTRLIKKVGKKNYKFNQNDMDKLDNILNGIKKILGKNKYKNTSYNKNKLKKIEVIRNQVRKINRNLVMYNHRKNGNNKNPFSTSFDKQINISENNKNVLKAKYSNLNKNLSNNIKLIHLALTQLYNKNVKKPPGLSNICEKIVLKTLKNINNQKVIVYSEYTSADTIRKHLSYRVPTYYGGYLYEHEINEDIYKKLMNGKTLDENNNELEKIELENKLLNYAVIGEMDIVEPKSNVNYHAVHAFGVNFERNTTVDYRKIFMNSENKYELYKKKVSHLYKNIFKGVYEFNEQYHNGQEFSIVLPAISLGAYLSSVRNHKDRKSLININIKELLDVIGNSAINKSAKVYLRFRDYNKHVLDNMLENKNYQSISKKINKNGNDLFETSDVVEKNQYYVNAWDTRSFIGNKLSTDPTIDGYFVAGWGWNKKLINNSYLHNTVIFNHLNANIIAPK